MNRFTIAQRVNIVKTFYENGESAASTYRALRAEYGSHNRPSERTISSTVKKFKATGTVTDVVRPVHYRNARSLENIAAVSESVAEDPSMSIPRRAKKLGLSYGTVWRILHTDLNLPPQNTGKGGRPKKAASESDDERCDDAAPTELNDKDVNEEAETTANRPATGAIKLKIESVVQEQGYRRKKVVAEKRAAKCSEMEEEETAKKRESLCLSSDACGTAKPASGKPCGGPKTVQAAAADNVGDDAFQNEKSNEELQFNALKGLSEGDFYLLRKQFS